VTSNLKFPPGATTASVISGASGGTLSIYDGSQPAGPGTPVAGQAVLVSVRLPPLEASTSGGIMSASTGPRGPVRAAAAGTATWFRVTSSSGSAVCDGSAGVSDADCLLVPTAAIQAGVNVTVSDLTISGPAAQDPTATVLITVPGAATTPPPSVPSGAGGTEPAYTGPSVSWMGYTWEIQGWGANSGWPAQGNVSVDSDGYLNLRLTQSGGNTLGAEVDSVRGDLGISGNKSTWGYGRYRWVIGTDLTAIDPTIVLGLFTFWAYGSPSTSPANQYGKGGPPGQKEIDIEASNWSPQGDHTPDTFWMLGYYQDTNATVISGLPATYGQQCHTLMDGSQQLITPGRPVSTVEFSWWPDHLTWNVWYSDITELATPPPPDHTLTMTQGQQYNWNETYGGNPYAGTVTIPPTGGQQVIMNLWTQGQNDPDIPATTVILRSFSYVPSDAQLLGRRMPPRRP
jgi:hypothetical protein